MFNRRRKVSKHFSQGLFRRTAKGTKSVNLGRSAHRGGYRF